MRVEILLSAVVCSYLRCVWKTLDAVLALQAYYQQLIAVKEASDVGVLTALNFLCRLIVVLLWVSVPSVFFSIPQERKNLLVEPASEMHGHYLKCPPSLQKSAK